MFSNFRFHLILLLCFTCSCARPIFSSSFRALPGNSVEDFPNNSGNQQVESEQSSNVTDYCLKMQTVLEQSECIQVLLEAYFGSNITLSCPSLSIKFAAAKCLGCPWRKMTPSIVSRTNRSLPLPHDEYFDSIERSCYLAKHMSSYNEYVDPLQGYVSEAALTAIFTIAISLLGVSSSRKISILGIRIPEAVYLFILWLAYVFYVFFWSRTLEYEIRCDDYHSFFSKGVSGYIIDVTVYSISLFRCYRLSLCTTSDCCRSSWAAFIADTSRNRDQRSIKAKVLSAIIIVLPTVLVAVFILEISDALKIGDYDFGSICSMGVSDLSTSYIQISKIVLQTCCVVVYAMRRPQNYYLRLLRFVVLILIFLSNIVLVVFRSIRYYYNPWEHTMLLPRVSDRHLASEIMEIANTFVVAILGILEPLRIRFEKNHDCNAGLCPILLQNIAS